jgi:hypothetical protein
MRVLFRPSQRWRGFLSDAAAVAGLAALVAILFRDTLFTAQGLVPSSRAYDVYYYFADSRAFTFDNMRLNHLPLWNPYCFSGCPNLGNFQAAAFYPPNMLYLFFSLDRAINFDIAGHVLLLASLMYAWCRSRGLSIAASFFAGTTVMFSGSYFPRVFAGHLTMLAVLAWTPLVFLCVDKLLARPRMSWMIIGMLAVSMQVMAGLPQGGFFTAGALAGYSGV